VRHAFRCRLFCSFLYLFSGLAGLIAFVAGGRRIAPRITKEKRIENTESTKEEKKEKQEEELSGEV
jgi:hypothetical protein